jgi:hypothetical protein
MLTICNAVFCVHELSMIPSVNSDYFLKLYQQVYLCNGEVRCSL